MDHAGEASAPARDVGYSDPIDAFEFGLADLGRIRRTVAMAAVASGLARDRADEVALAVNEIACNALVHGEPPARLRIWEGDGALTCQVSDAGEGIKDVRAGQALPPAERIGGRGLWLARELSDAMEIRNVGGCTVSLRATAPS
jgi:serine/threonine-protein kinase RsbW